MKPTLSAVVIGAGGYVGGELLRLIADHPDLELGAAVSDTRAGTPIAELLPNLKHSLGDQPFVSSSDPLADQRTGDRVAVFAAAPHGASGQAVQKLLDQAAAKGLTTKVVDLSADFRHRSAETFKEIYGVEHPAPSLLRRFQCALPEHTSESVTEFVSHPGCFATAATLAAAPLFAADLVEPEIFVSGVTGSTGSGRSPISGTHHPERHSNLYAYKPLCHRHAPEIATLIEQRTRVRPQVHFVPHSGPFARGIHITLAARLKSACGSDHVLSTLREFYAASPFIDVADAPPRLKDVVASNQARLNATVSGSQLVVFCVIDNLVKGAAGGALQWMNRLWSLPEETGLRAPAPGWT